MRNIDKATMRITITPERPDSPDAMMLIAELEAHLEPLYPAESRHGFSVERLVSEGVDFFLARIDGEAAGCGGVKLYPPEYGEVKRMYVRPQWRGRGVGKAILDHLAEFTCQQKIGILRLETGIHQGSAIALYEGFGFRRISPFGEYREDPLSLFFEKHLQDSPLAT